MTQIIKTLRSGQITIPSSYREKLGIDSQTLLQISLAGNELRIKPVKISTAAKNTAWFKKLYDRFSPVRKEAQSYSQRQIDKYIDRAVKAVRKQHAQNRH